MRAQATRVLVLYGPLVPRVRIQRYRWRSKTAKRPSERPGRLRAYRLAMGMRVDRRWRE